MATTLFTHARRLTSVFSCALFTLVRSDGAETESVAILFPEVTLGTSFGDIARKRNLLPVTAATLDKNAPRIFSLKAEPDTVFEGYLLFFSEKDRLTSIVGVCRKASNAPIKTRTVLARFKTATSRLGRSTFVGKTSRFALGYAYEDANERVILELIPASAEVPEVESFTITKTIRDTDLSEIGWEPLPPTKNAYAEKVLDDFVNQKPTSK